MLSPRCVCVLLLACASSHALAEARTFDWQFFQLFGDEDAARTYALELLGAVSDRYREQIGVILTIPTSRA